MTKSKAAAPPVRAGKKFDKVEMPLVEDVLGSDFEEIGAEVAELVAERKKLDDQIKEKYAILRALMEEVNDDASWSARGEGWTVSYVVSKPRETLVKELLIQQGVTLRQIEKATKSTPVTPFVTIRLTEEE